MCALPRNDMVFRQSEHPGFSGVLFCPWKNPCRYAIIIQIYAFWEEHYAAGSFFAENGSPAGVGIPGLSGKPGTAPGGGIAVQSPERGAAGAALCGRAGALGAGGLLLRPADPAGTARLPRGRRILPTGGQCHGAGGAAGSEARRAGLRPVRRPRRQDHPDRRSDAGAGLPGVQRNQSQAGENSFPEYRADGGRQRPGDERAPGNPGKPLPRLFRPGAGGCPLLRRGHVPQGRSRRHRLEPGDGSDVRPAPGGDSGQCRPAGKTRRPAGVFHLHLRPRRRTRKP